jgi:hypothetical protein
MATPLPDYGRAARWLATRLLGRDFAAVDPDLHADSTVGREGVNLGVADVGAERSERDSAFLVPLATSHLGAAEATRDGDLHALGAGLHRPLDGLLHRLLEGNSAGQLLADVGGDRAASSSGWRISLTSSLTLRLVSAPTC